MQKYSYLLINILSILGPLILSFDKKVFFYKKWKFTLPGLAISSVLFLIWDLIFTKKNVWSFNDSYIIGVKFGDLPLEEILFFITIPFACLFIYECLNCYFPSKFSPKNTQLITLILGIISIITLCFGINKLYTSINFGTLLITFIVFVWILNFNKMGAFYRAFIVCLIPFYIVNGILTSIPIVSYNNYENLGIRIGTIPLEDHFYLMALLLINVYFYEKYKSKNVA